MTYTKGFLVVAVIAQLVTMQLAAATVPAREPVSTSTQHIVTGIGTVIGAAAVGGSIWAASADASAGRVALGVVGGAVVGTLIGYSASGYNPMQLFNWATPLFEGIKNDQFSSLRSVRYALSVFGGNYPLIDAREYIAKNLENTRRLNRMFYLISIHPEGLALRDQCDRARIEAQKIEDTLRANITTIAEHPDYAEQRRLFEKARIAAEAAAIERQKVQEKQKDRLQRLAYGR